MIKASPNGLAYLSHEGLSNLTGNNKRQNNVMRKNLSHILQSKWKKKIKIDGVVRSKVIIFKHTPEGEIILNNSGEYCGKIKAGTPMPISIYKDEKYIKEDRSSKSTFLKKQEPRSLSDMYHLLDQSIFDELRSKGGRDFSNNFISQRVLAMSKKPQLQTRNFKTREGFIAYMSLALKYELHDAVKTANIDFRLRANIKEYDNESCVKKVKPPQEELILPKGIWGEVLKKLIAEFGIDTYKNWFSKLTANVDEVTKTIRLKASSNFIKDWIERNYQCTMEKFITDFNFTW
jgi:hypothetical protein